MKDYYETEADRYRVMRYLRYTKRMVHAALRHGYEQMRRVQL